MEALTDILVLAINVIHQETCRSAFDGFWWLLMAFEASKAIRSHKAESRESQLTLGARGPGTSDYMLRTLRSLVKFTWLLIGNNISGTFQM